MSSLSFNNIRKPYLLVTNRVRKYWAPRELVLTQNRKAGSRLRKVKSDVRVEEAHIEISDVEGMNLRKTAEDLAGWLLSDTERELIFDDEADRSYFAIVDGSLDAEEIVSVGYGIIRFVCPESYKYGSGQSLDLMSSSNQTFLVTGQASTPWSSRTVFTVPQSQFTLESSTGKIILNYDFIAGDVLEIDYESRDITVSGINIDVGLSMESVWFELEPGEIQMKASHETEIKYTERYY